MNSNPKMNGILLSKQGAIYSKGLRLARKQPKWNDEKVLTEKQIEEYIESMMKKYKDEPKVANVLIKYLELKQKSRESNFLEGKE